MENNIVDNIVAEIKQTPVVVAKDKAKELMLVSEQVLKAKQFIEQYEAKKSELAEYCEANHILDIVVGDTKFTVIHSAPKSISNVKKFDEGRFKEDAPYLYETYLVDSVVEKKGHKAYLRESKRNG